MKKNIIKFLLFSFTLIFLGWGSVGHKIINKNATLFFPTELNFLLFWAAPLSDHASDADIRKSFDPNEGPKHYIDIDNYPEFVLSGRITQNFDSLIMQHGSSFVFNQGILPWAIIQKVDSLQVAFQRGDWQKAMLVASDLGHYVGDAHMPLHITKNYDGQYSGQSGVHSRYESNMINTYHQQILYSGDSVSFIPNVSEFVFEMLYTNYDYVDSVLQADLDAKNYGGGNDNSAYYQKLWELTKNFTLKLFKNASYDIACLIYTAWKNSGEPVSTNIEDKKDLAIGFKLEQNYPNPFNPSTTLRYAIPLLEGDENIPASGGGRLITLKVYDILGNETAILVNEYKSAGNYEVDFDGNKLTGGVYFYQLKAGRVVQTKKMILLH